MQTVKDLANSRFDWEQALRDLSRAVPADVTIGSFKGDLGSTQGAAAGGSALRSALTAPAITLTGCTYSQTKVAKLMARLRNIDGVTRVSLSKSDKEATADGSSTERNAPSATGFCGTQRRAGLRAGRVLRRRRRREHGAHARRRGAPRRPRRRAPAGTTPARLRDPGDCAAHSGGDPGASRHVHSRLDHP